MIANVFGDIDLDDFAIGRHKTPVEVASKCGEFLKSFEDCMIGKVKGEKVEKAPE